MAARAEDGSGMTEQQSVDRAFYTVAEVCDLTGVSAKSVYRAIERDELRAVRPRGQRRLLIPTEAVGVWLEPVEPVRRVHEEPPAAVASRRPPARGSREALRALEQRRAAS